MIQKTETAAFQSSDPEIEFPFQSNGLQFDCRISFMQIQINEEKKELKQHGDYTFPVHLSGELLSRYEGGAFFWHWHTEIELTLILKGQIEYRVNERTYHLRAGDGLFCNSNAMHAGRRIDGQDCQYFSTTFHPRFLYGFENSILQTRYVDPILNTAAFSSAALYHSEAWSREILRLLGEIYQLYQVPAPDQELQLHILLSEIWRQLYGYFTSCSFEEPSSFESISRLKEILSYIHRTYAGPVTLEEIADHVHLSKSECCRFFKRHMNMTIFDYLLYYRIQQSLPLLQEGLCTISKAAEVCGFSNACYYGKLFKRYMNCTPRQYQARFRRDSTVSRTSGTAPVSSV